MNRFLVHVLMGILLAVCASAQQIPSGEEEAANQELEARLTNVIEEGRYSMMKGLPGVALWEIDLGEHEGVGGLFARDIRADIEAALTDSGVKVLTYRDAYAHAAQPFLIASFDITALDEDRTLFFYSIELDLMQTVTLWDGESMPVSTWNTHVNGSWEQQTLWQLRRVTSAKIQAFTNDWLKANPK